MVDAVPGPDVRQRCPGHHGVTDPTGQEDHDVGARRNGHQAFLVHVDDEAAGRGDDRDPGSARQPDGRRRVFEVMGQLPIVGGPGLLVDVAEHRLDPEGSGQVPEEEHHGQDTAERQHVGHGDREPGDERGLPLGGALGAHGSQHGEGVHERGGQLGQGQLDDPVGGEGLQQPGGVLAAAQLEGHDCQREDQPRHGDERSGDRGEQVACRRRSAAEDEGQGMP